MLGIQTCIVMYRICAGAICASLRGFVGAVCRVRFYTVEERMHRHLACLVICRQAGWLLVQLGKYKGGSAVTLDDAHALVHVDSIDVGRSMAADRSRECVLHATVFWVHVAWHGSSHEQLDGQELGLFAKALGGRVKRKELLPVGLVGGVVVGLDPSASDPNGLARRILGVLKCVAVSGHDAFDRLVDILVGSASFGRVAFDRKGRNNAAKTKEKRNVSDMCFE